MSRAPDLCFRIGDPAQTWIEPGLEFEPTPERAAEEWVKCHWDKYRTRCDDCLVFVDEPTVEVRVWVECDEPGHEPSRREYVVTVETKPTFSAASAMSSSGRVGG